MLNTDLEIYSKALAAKLKFVLASLVALQQTAYVQNRYMGEGRRLISDILDIPDKFKIDCYSVTVNIEKSFDSLDPRCLLVIFLKNGFRNIFVNWNKILLTNQESSVINGSRPAPYFKLEKGTQQGDPTYLYLFIIPLEISFAIS